MGERPNHEKLSAFFRELSPAARARLASALEGEQGLDLPFRALITGPLEAARLALGEISVPVAPERELLAPLDPFLVAENGRTKTTGVLSVAGRDRIAGWIARTFADVVEGLREPLKKPPGSNERRSAVSAAQDELVRRIADALAKAATPRERGRLGVQIGGEHAAADLEDVAAVLRHRVLLGKFTATGNAAPAHGEDLLHAAKVSLEPIAAKAPAALPFALILIRARLRNPQSFVRLAAIAADSTDGSRICETPFRSVLDLALADAERSLIRAHNHGSTADRPIFLSALRSFGANARALGTEIDLVPDGHHARHLAGLRREMAETIRGDIQDIAPRVRALVRPRGKEFGAGIDQGELERLKADIDLLIIARAFAEETALNALSGRAFFEVRDLLDTGTPLLIDRLRAADETTKTALRSRLAALVAVSERFFNAEYAAHLAKAIEVAGQEARPAKQA